MQKIDGMREMEMPHGLSQGLAPPGHPEIGVGTSLWRSNNGQRSNCTMWRGVTLEFKHKNSPQFLNLISVLQGTQMRNPEHITASFYILTCASHKFVCDEGRPSCFDPKLILILNWELWEHNTCRVLGLCAMPSDWEILHILGEKKLSIKYFPARFGQSRTTRT